MKGLKSMDNFPERLDIRAARRHFSKIGFALFFSIVAAVAGQFGFSLLIKNMKLEASWIKWAVSFIPMYIIAMPLAVLVLKRIKGVPPERKKLKTARFFELFTICFPAMSSGNILGIMLSYIFSGGTAQNGLLQYVMDENIILKVLVTVVAAPLFEEFIFRKLLIDRSRAYGEGLAILLSSAMFAAFHGNLFQIFYAFATGLVFGYVYISSGKMIYSAIMHMAINFLGGVIAPYIIQNSVFSLLASGRAAADTLHYAGVMIITGIYSMVISAATVLGIVFFSKNVRRIRFSPMPLQLAKGTAFKTAFLNAGMILFFAACTALIVKNLFPAG